MSHKNAQQLMEEVGELISELEVYSGQRDAFFLRLKKLDRDYDSGRLAYIQYEEKQKAALRGRSRKEMSDYYAANIFSLLKKIEFIIAQAIAIVRGDNSFSAITVRGIASAKLPSSITPDKPLDAPQQAAMQASYRVDVFNIDNEIARLKRLLAPKSVGSQGIVAGVEVSRLKISIPWLDELAADIERYEAASKSRLASMVPVQNAQPSAKLADVFPASVFRKRGFDVSSIAKRAVAVLKRVFKAAAGIPLAAARSLQSAVRTLGAKSKKPQPDFFMPAAASEPEKQPRPSGRILPQKEGVFSALMQLLNPKKAKKGIFVEEIVAMEKQAKAVESAPMLEQKEPAGLAFGWFSARGMVRELTEKFRPRQEPIMGEKTAIPIHLKKLKEMRRKIYEEERLSGFDATLLAQEARRIKKILEVEKPEVYQGSSVGLIANLTVRKISLFLVDTFPEFFGFLYNGLRSANVKVLSNTYVNIMILSTLFVTVASFFVLGVLFFFIGYPLYQIVLRSVVLSAVAGFSCATIFYAYPFMKIKDRRRKIMTNMPFGINHMAAVATSGVPPVSMFELIAASGEYSEICIEVKKIVDFINIFGYDLLTALRTVAATTPSPHFKEFLAGMVSTIETGGDLDRYLRQEADQATLTYNLERQRYNETVSTYSDIYTGLLIAAPLFFVAAMALVNLLGGTLGGIGVDVVMAVGAYAVIPLLNIAFLMFLQFTQPEV